MRLNTSLRVKTAASTWAGVRELMPRLGISRVTDITALDRLGLPVFASVRPRGLTLRVHAGKGATPDEARAGALMEAVEFAVAESASLAAPDATLPLREVVAQWPGGLLPQHFAPRHGVCIDPDARCSAVACELLGSRRRVLLPAELVHMPWKDASQPSWFGWSSNGLASGNTLEEATLHALLEVLERDALAMNTARDDSQRLPVASLPPPFKAWAERWGRDGVELIVRHVPNAFGLPCFAAYLSEAGSLDVNLAGGTGLHPDRGVALARAVCEAAQARLSTIHGGRDDVTGFFAKFDDLALARRLRLEQRRLRTLRDESRQIAFEQVPHFAVRSPAAALRSVRRRLTALGFPYVFRHRMPWPSGLPGRALVDVVKVIIPGCESLKGHNRRVGPRLQARVLGSG